MKPYVWKQGMSPEEEANGAYWERNMMVVLFSMLVQSKGGHAGWYVHGEWEGWSRVVSFWNGAATFHIPDDFDVGNLPQIEPNWDGHTTEQKWEKIMELLGMKVDK